MLRWWPGRDFNRQWKYMVDIDFDHAGRRSVHRTVVRHQRECLVRNAALSRCKFRYDALFGPDRALPFFGRYRWFGGKRTAWMVCGRRTHRGLWPVPERLRIARDAGWRTDNVRPPARRLPLVYRFAAIDRALEAHAGTDAMFKSRFAFTSIPRKHPCAYRRMPWPGFRILPTYR